MPRILGSSTVRPGFTEVELDDGTKREFNNNEMVALAAAGTFNRQPQPLPPPKQALPEPGSEFDSANLYATPIASGPARQSASPDPSEQLALASGPAVEQRGDQTALPTTATSSQTQTTTTAGSPTVAKALAAYSAADEALRTYQASDEYVATEKRRLKNEHELTQAALDLAKQQELDGLNRDANFNFALGDIQTRRAAADEELQKFEFKDYWADKSTGSKILAALASGLGAYASAMTGTKNYALEIIQDAVDRDTTLQKLRYQQLRDKGQGADEAFSRAVQQYGSLESAAKAKEAYAWKLVEQRATEFATRPENADPVRRENALKVAAEAAAKNAGLLAQLDNEARGEAEIVTTTQTKPTEIKIDTPEPVKLAISTNKERFDRLVERRQGVEQFRSLRENGAFREALATWIATPAGIRQGSFTDSLQDVTLTKDLGDRINFMLSTITGGEPTAVMDKLQKSVDETYSQELRSMDAPLKFINDYEKKAGAPLGAYTGGFIAPSMQKSEKYVSSDKAVK